VKHATLVKRLASPELVDGWLTADAKRRNTQTQFDSLRNEQKRLGELVGKLKREVKTGTSQELEKLIAEANAIKMRQDALMADLTAAESDCQTIMLQLPAIPDPSWPVGKDECENIVTRTWSDPAHSPLQLDAGGKDHVTLGKELGIMDLERGVKLAGSRSYVLRGLGARLYWSVLRFAQDFLVARGYELMVVPVLVSEQCMIGDRLFPGRSRSSIHNPGRKRTRWHERGSASEFL
jgi:seryl-tRNA synthetase